MTIPGLLGGPAPARGARVSAPRRAVVRGTPHHLAYITEEEAALLRARGGGLTQDGRQLHGPAGLPAFEGGDGSDHGLGAGILGLLSQGPDPRAAQREAWRAALAAPIDQTPRNFVAGGGGAPPAPVARYDYGALPSTPPVIGALQSLPAAPGIPQTGGASLPPAPNLGLPSHAPPRYGMQPATLARLQQAGVMPRYGAAGLAGNPDFGTLLGRMR